MAKSPAKAFLTKIGRSVSPSTQAEPATQNAPESDENNYLIDSFRYYQHEYYTRNGPMNMA